MRILCPTMLHCYCIHVRVDTLFLKIFVFLVHQVFPPAILVVLLISFNLIGTIEWGGECHTCPTGAQCFGKNNIFAEQGWWLLSPLSSADPPNLFHCDPQVCLFNSCRTHHTGVSFNLLFFILYIIF